jgi:hypothetical protein
MNGEGNVEKNNEGVTTDRASRDLLCAPCLPAGHKKKKEEKRKKKQEQNQLDYSSNSKLQRNSNKGITRIESLFFFSCTTFPAH